MTEISEQEARAAARHLESARKKCNQLVDDECDTRWVERDIDKHCWLLACFAVQELTRREAERAERARLIDAEWLESIGLVKSRSCVAPCVDLFTTSTPIPSSTIELSECPGGSWYVLLIQDDDCISLPNITTRGQLLDLLAALKGGE